ncbi:MAG: rhodanese-like domain-containing protein [Pseudomonadota bacterium]
MDTFAGPQISELSPREAWMFLSENAASVLVDVRTRPEWGFVGGPDLSELSKGVVHVEWQTWPDMTENPAFAGEVFAQVGDLPSAFLFICRSGARSMRAAQSVAEALAVQGASVACINVAEGFEGDLDPHGRRGGLTGWKARGLAWRQS